MIRSAATPRHSNQDIPVVLVAINARRARILRWRDGEVIQLEIPSDVPGRHRSTGHLRRDPRVRHGGSGFGQDAIDGVRNARVHDYLVRVTDALDADGRVLVLGSGRLPAELVRALEEREHGRPDPRPIELEHAGYRTDRQLRARLLAAAGHAPRRSQAPPRRLVGSLRRTLGRAGEREAIEDQLDEWEEPIRIVR